MLNNDLEMAFLTGVDMDLCNDVCGELESLFNNVLSTVVDYFEEVVVE